MKPCVIYALVDPRDRRVRYVGSTKHPTNRLSQHLYKATHPTATRSHRLCDWIKGLLDDGLMPQMTPLEECGAEERVLREAEWISRYAAHDLLNVYKASTPVFTEMPDRAAEMFLDGRSIRFVAKAMNVSCGTAWSWKNGGVLGHEGLDAWRRRRAACSRTSDGP